MVSVNIYGGGCDLVDNGVVWPPPVTQQGNKLAILLTGGHEEDPEFCDPGAGTYTFPVGIYPPGTYTLEVDWRYSTFSGWVTETLSVIPFTVTGAPPAQLISMPTLTLAGLTGLLLMLVGAASIDLQRRARLRC